MIRALAQFLSLSTVFSMGQLCVQGGQMLAAGPGGTSIGHSDLE